MTKNAIASGENSYTVLVDNATAQNNVTRFAQKEGFTVSVSSDGEDIALSLNR